MRIAVPLTGTKLAEKAEEADLFALYDIEKGKILVKDVAEPAEGEDLEAFLKEQVVTHLLTPQISSEWKDRLERARIRVVTGVDSEMGPDNLVQDFLAGILK